MRPRAGELAERGELASRERQSPAPPLIYNASPNSRLAGYRLGYRQGLRAAGGPNQAPPFTPGVYTNPCRAFEWGCLT